MDPQVDKIMAARRKDWPLAAKWAPIKSKHKALSNRSIFEGDLDSPLKAYDDAVQTYADAVKGKQELADVLASIFANLNKVKGDMDKLKADRDKSEEDAANNRDFTQVEKYSKQPDADPAEVMKSLDSFASSIEKALALHKRVMEQIVATGMTQTGVVQKGRDEYRAKAQKLESTLQKAYDDAYKAQGDIRSVLTDFIATAEEIENIEMAKQLRGLYKYAAT